MVSTQQSSRAEQVASNARSGADGGFIFADAPNAVTSAVVIIHQISMHRNITPLRVIRSSRVSSRASGGFTTIGQGNSSPARSFPLLTRIRWINRRPDQPNGCRQTGKRCFTNRGGSFGCGQFRLQNYFRSFPPLEPTLAFSPAADWTNHMGGFRQRGSPVLVRPPRLTLPFHSQPVCLKLDSMKPRR
jgi:hypothetical protein